MNRKCKAFLAEYGLAEKQIFIFLLIFKFVFYNTHTHTHTTVRCGVKVLVGRVKKVPQLALKTLYGIFMRSEKKIISRGPLTPVVSESLSDSFFFLCSVRFIVGVSEFMVLQEYMFIYKTHFNNVIDLFLSYIFRSLLSLVFFILA